MTTADSIPITSMIIINFIFLTMPSSNGIIAYYTLCSSNPVFSCGRITNVGYPFWGGDRPKFCGRPEFSLFCQDNTSNPLILLGTADNGALNKASVIDVNVSSHTMLLVEEQFLKFQNNLPCWPIVNNSLTNLSPAFKFSKLVSNISLLFDCDSTVSNYHLKSLNCSIQSSGNKTGFYVDKPSDANRIGKSCATVGKFPVLKSELDELNDITVTPLDVLKKGFEVDYEVNFTACLSCQNSGGMCGSPDDPLSTNFVCYCPHGPHPLVCPKSGSAARVTRKLVIITSGSAALAALMVVALIICIKRRHSAKTFAILGSRGIRDKQNVEAFLKSYGFLAPKRYKYTDIKKITGCFKDKLGEGGFGVVYKGRLHDGQLVAVKKLKKMKGNGEDFINEVVSISTTNHVNVVALKGYCIDGSKRALVYEFLPNGSLEKFVYGAGNRQTLQFETLFKIAVGIARGLDYLHRGCNTRILHFDIKPHNILLDEEFCPKISDFGLAKLCPTKDSTVSMLEARGTIGFIAPEVFCRNFGGVSHKSDVYSYGMMVLDMACGRENVCAELHRSSEMYFPEWIYNRLEHGEEVGAHAVLFNEDEKVLRQKMILVSLWCIQTYPSNRPQINRVLEMLEGPLESLQLPPKPHLSSPPVSLIDFSTIASSTT